jgi:hypothetical protein
MLLHPAGDAKGGLKDRLPGLRPRLKAGEIDAFALVCPNEGEKTAGEVSLPQHAAQMMQAAYPQYSASYREAPDLLQS